MSILFLSFPIIWFLCSNLTGKIFLNREIKFCFFSTGMNPIVLYMGHEVLHRHFPISWEVSQYHYSLLSMDLWGTVFWVLVGLVLYKKRIFITVWSVWTTWRLYASLFFSLQNMILCQIYRIISTWLLKLHVTVWWHNQFTVSHNSWFFSPYICGYMYNTKLMVLYVIVR